MRNESHGQRNKSLLEPWLENLRVKRIIKYLPLNGNVCDIGCGYNADFLHKIKKNISQGFGFDISVNIDMSDQKIILQTADLNQMIPLPDNMTDAVTSLAVLEHLTNAQQNINEIYRILKPQGKLLLTTPTPLSKPLLEFLSYRLKIVDPSEIHDHKHYYDQSEITDLLINAGFQKTALTLKTWQFGLNNFIIAIK